MLKVLVKPKDQLLKELELFIAKHKNSFTESGRFSEESFRATQLHIIDEIAGKTFFVEKVMHKDNINYHYTYPYFHIGAEQLYGCISPEDIEMEFGNE